MEDVLNAEIIKGVLEKLVMQVEFNFLTNEDELSL